MKQDATVYIVIFAIVFQATSAQTTYNILGNLYKVIVDQEITDIPQPQYIQYANEIRIINRYIYYMKDFTKTNDPTVSHTRKMTKRYNAPKVFMNRFGDIMDVQEGRIYFTYREKSYEVITKDNCKTTYITGSYQNSICFLMCKTSSEGNQQRYLFGYDSSKPNLVENRVKTEELNLLGDDLITVDFNDKTGNIALAAKTSNGWKLMVLEYTKGNESGDEAVITSTVEVITTEPVPKTTTATTENTPTTTTTTAEKIAETSSLAWNYDDIEVTTRRTTARPTVTFTNSSNAQSNVGVVNDDFHEVLEGIINKIMRAHEFNVNRHTGLYKNRNKMLERILETRQIKVNSLQTKDITQNYIDEFKKVVTVNGNTLEKVHVNSHKEPTVGDKNRIKELEDEVQKYKKEAERYRRMIMTSSRVDIAEEDRQDSTGFSLSNIPSLQFISAFELPTEKNQWYDYSCIKNEMLRSQKAETDDDDGDIRFEYSSWKS
ncbi:uncharacterized protein LOC143916229 isoform X2 [Arctopsyche grandis]|uniref:uncharacterized protein LOC143916229 isoform X2 n=1 Tax=Arctopsyche grandis TaxID=121162 RepID=UPI00406D873D